MKLSLSLLTGTLLLVQLTPARAEEGHETRPEIRLGAMLQPEFVWFPDDEGDHTRNEFRLRRLRPLFRASWGDFGLRLIPDIASGQLRIMDASVEARLWHEDKDALTLRVGKDKPPVSMDLLGSSTTLSLLERGPTSQLSPLRDIGVALIGTYGPLEVHAMLANGAADGATTDTNSDDSFEASARLGVHLGPAFVGVSGSIGEARGATVSTYRTPGRRTLRALPTGDSPASGDGLRWRAGAHARLVTGPLLLWGEALLSHHEVARDDASIDLGSAGAWEAGVSWLVGADNAWDAAHKPGTLEVALRFGGLDENPFNATEVLGDGDLAVDPGRGFMTGAFALSWQVDSHLRAVLGYEVTNADGMNLEHLVGLRLQGYLLEML